MFAPRQVEGEIVGASANKLHNGIASPLKHLASRGLLLKLSTALLHSIDAYWGGNMKSNSASMKITLLRYVLISLASNRACQRFAAEECVSALDRECHDIIVS